MPPNGGTVRSGRSTRGGRLPVIRCLAGASPGAKPRCDIDFAVFYLFACAAGPPGKKGDATKSGTSLPLQFMIERQFRHTSNRGSVAPRRTSNRRFTSDFVHSSLLRRGATEPPESLPLYTFYMFYTANPPARAASLRLCVKNRHDEKRQPHYSPAKGLQENSFFFASARGFTRTRMSSGFLRGAFAALCAGAALAAAAFCDS